MNRIDVVCLCDSYDLKALFADFFSEDHSWVNLLSPDEVTHPESIVHAVAFRPGPRAFDAYPNLRLVSSAGAGVDGLLDNPSLRPEIDVSRLTVVEQAQGMAGFAVWFIVGWHRSMWHYAPAQAKQEWDGIKPAPMEDFPVGILGHGNIGSHLSQTLRALGYPVTAYGRTARIDGEVQVVSGSEGLAEIAKGSRAIVNLLPLTKQTQDILSASFFANMRSDAILIHLGRGPHLVEEDLVKALDQGHLAMAALDVFASEPLPADHPFWRHDKIKVTPHVSGDVEFRAVCAWIAAGIRRFEKGETPEGLVDRERGY